MTYYLNKYNQHTVPITIRYQLLILRSNLAQEIGTYRESNLAVQLQRIHSPNHSFKNVWSNARNQIPGTFDESFKDCLARILHGRCYNILSDENKQTASKRSIFSQQVLSDTLVWHPSIKLQGCDIEARYWLYWSLHSKYASPMHHCRATSSQRKPSFLGERIKLMMT